MNIDALESAFQPTPDGKSAVGQHGMVATAFPLATKAGAEMLRRGGNAVDAACASAFALGVCEPQASGLGGESKALVHFNGETIAVDGSSRVPALFDAEAAGQGSITEGYKGTSVPSMVAVIGHLHKRFGRLAWSEILAPAIRIAGEGYAITKLQRDLQIRDLHLFKNVSTFSGSRYFLKAGSVPYDIGEQFVQPDLALLLRAISDKGPEYFYRGEPARRIDEDMRANGGFLRFEDLEKIPQPVERKPLSTYYRKHKIVTMPPPSGGRMLLFTLNVLNRLPPTLLSRRTPETCALLAEVFRTALLANETEMPHPDSYNAEKDPMLSGIAVDEMMKQIIRATSSDAGGETTHLSTMDEDGNAVGITQSVNSVYGSKAAAEGLGFIYNNYLIDMNRNDPNHPHYLKPDGNSPSYVAPTLVFSDGAPWLLTGSPGSQRIFTTVAQFLSNVMDRNMTIFEAIKEPRMHCTSEGCVNLEAERFHPDVLSYLADRGYKIEKREPWSFYHGAVHAVLRSQTGKGFQGAAEIRRDGTAEGY